MNEVLLAAGKIVCGLAVLIVGGELLVRGASALAAAMRISPLVIGLTVVAFGTSAPELAVSLQSAFVGKTDLGVGNVVGSNIFNVLLILGLSALITPLVVDSQLIRRDVPLMIAASAALLILGWDGSLGRLDGALLFGSLLAYIVWSVRASRRESRAVQDEFAQELPAPAEGGRALLLQLLLVGGGLVLLGFGSHWLVDGSVALATMMGVGELVIGLTIVAGGTSLPEVVTAIVAAWRGERDIAVGNVVGSNLFNILCVLGLSSVVAPHGIAVSAEALRFDIPVMIAVAVACLPIFFTGALIARWEGGLLLFYYLAYTTILVLQASGNGLALTLTAVMLFFVVPLTAVALGVSLYRAWRTASK